MRNHKGEIATFLTLGLVIVGAVVTLATSFLTNQQKNLASNPKAAPVASKCYIIDGQKSCPAGQVQIRLYGTNVQCGNGLTYYGKTSISEQELNLSYRLVSGNCYTSNQQGSGGGGGGANQTVCQFDSRYNASEKCGSNGYTSEGCPKNINNKQTYRCKDIAPASSSDQSDGQLDSQTTGCGSGGRYPCNHPDINKAICPKPNLEFACCVKDKYNCNGEDRYRWYGCTGQPCENTKISQSNGPGTLVACPSGIGPKNPESCQSDLPSEEVDSPPYEGCENKGTARLCGEYCMSPNVCQASQGKTERKWCCPAEKYIPAAGTEGGLCRTKAGEKPCDQDLICQVSFQGAPPTCQKPAGGSNQCILQTTTCDKIVQVGGDTNISYYKSSNPLCSGKCYGLANAAGQVECDTLTWDILKHLAKIDCEIIAEQGGERGTGELTTNLSSNTSKKCRINQFIVNDIKVENEKDFGEMRECDHIFLKEENGITIFRECPKFLEGDRCQYSCYNEKGIFNCKNAPDNLLTTSSQITFINSSNASFKIKALAVPFNSDLEDILKETELKSREYIVVKGPICNASHFYKLYVKKDGELVVNEEKKQCGTSFIIRIN